MILLSCHELNIGYDGKTIVEHINLEITNGDYICIVGENGSGKSTLMKTLVNLILPISGKLKYDPTIRPQSIGYLPQQIQVQQDFPASVYEVVLSGCLNRLGYYPFYRKKEKEIANRYLKLLEISHLRIKPFRELSGGQQQRVLLARALCSTDKILFLDEPFSGIDLFMAQQIYSIIDLINKEYGVTIVMISHDIKSALKYATKVIHVDKTITFQGSPKEYIQSEVGIRYLGGRN